MSSFQRRWLLILLLLVTYAIAYDGDIDGNLDFFHEGDRLAHMDKLHSGGLPFRDIYVQQGLGENILKPALACKFWGPSVASLRRLGQNTSIYRGVLPPLGLICTLVAIYLLTGRLTITSLSAVVLLGCWNEITERQGLGMLAVACVGRFINCRKPIWLALAGFFSAAATLYSLEVGLYAISAILVWIFLDHSLARNRGIARAFRPVLIFGLGTMAIVAPFWLWLAHHELVTDFLLNISIQLFWRGSVVPASYPWPTLDAGFGMFARQAILFYVTPLALVTGFTGSLLSLRRTYTPEAAAVLLASLFGLAFWISVMGRPDIWHVAFTVGPFVLFAATMINAECDRRRRGTMGVIGIALSSICIVTLLLVGHGGAMARKLVGDNSANDLVACQVPRLQGIRISTAQAGFVTALVNYIHEHSRPDETIADMSDFGLIYFLAERESPTRFHLMSHVGTSGLRATMMKEIRAGSPKIIIRRAEPLVAGDYLDDFVAENYVHDAGIGTLELWLRK